MWVWLRSLPLSYHHHTQTIRTYTCDTNIYTVSSFRRNLQRYHLWSVCMRVVIVQLCGMLEHSVIVIGLHRWTWLVCFVLEIPQRFSWSVCRHSDPRRSCSLIARCTIIKGGVITIIEGLIQYFCWLCQIYATLLRMKGGISIVFAADALSEWKALCNVQKTWYLDTWKTFLGGTANNPKKWLLQKYILNYDRILKLLRLHA